MFWLRHQEHCCTPWHLRLLRVLLEVVSVSWRLQKGWTRWPIEVRSNNRLAEPLRIWQTAIQAAIPPQMKPSAVDNCRPLIGEEVEVIEPRKWRKSNSAARLLTCQLCLPIAKRYYYNRDYLAMQNDFWLLLHISKSLFLLDLRCYVLLDSCVYFLLGINHLGESIEDQQGVNKGLKKHPQSPYRPQRIFKLATNIIDYHLVFVNFFGERTLSFIRNFGKVWQSMMCNRDQLSSALGKLVKSCVFFVYYFTYFLSFISNSSQVPVPSLASKCSDLGSVPLFFEQCWHAVL
jgi:hypothetical protein